MTSEPTYDPDRDIQMNPEGHKLVCLSCQKPVTDPRPGHGMHSLSWGPTPTTCFSYALVGLCDEHEGLTVQEQRKLFMERLLPIPGMQPEGKFIGNMGRWSSVMHYAGPEDDPWRYGVLGCREGVIPDTWDVATVELSDVTWRSLETLRMPIGAVVDAELP